MLYEKSIQNGGLVVEKTIIVRTKHEICYSDIATLAHREAERLQLDVYHYNVSDDKSYAYISFVGGTVIRYNQITPKYEKIY